MNKGVNIHRLNQGTAGQHYRKRSNKLKSGEGQDTRVELENQNKTKAHDQNEGKQVGRTDSGKSGQGVTLSVNHYSQSYIPSFLK